MAKTKLYYLGGLTPPGKESEHTVTAGESTFVLPPAGEYLEVEEWQANQILRKHNYGEGRQAFTRHRLLAERVASGEYRISGAQEGQVVVERKMTQEDHLRAAGLSDEQIKTIVNQSAGSDLINDALDLADDDEIEEIPPKSKKSGSKSSPKSRKDES